MDPSTKKKVETRCTRAPLHAHFLQTAQGGWGKHSPPRPCSSLRGKPKLSKQLLGTCHSPAAQPARGGSLGPLSLPGQAGWREDGSDGRARAQAIGLAAGGLRRRRPWLPAPCQQGVSVKCGDGSDPSCREASQLCTTPRQGGKHYSAPPRLSPAPPARAGALLVRDPPQEEEELHDRVCTHWSPSRPYPWYFLGISGPSVLPSRLVSNPLERLPRKGSIQRFSRHFKSIARLDLTFPRRASEPRPIPPGPPSFSRSRWAGTLLVGC